MANNYLEVLLARLSKKDIMPGEMPGLLRDVLNIISSVDTVTVEGINRNLAMLGWQEDIVDAFTFEIMQMLIEEKDGDGPAQGYGIAGRSRYGGNPFEGQFGPEKE